MKWWIGFLIISVCLGGTFSRSWADPVSDSHYELYSWKTGNDWTFALLPVSKERRMDTEIRQSGKLRGADEVKGKLLGMKEGDVVAWQTRPDSAMVYPPDSIIQEIADYAQSVNVTLLLQKVGHAK